MASSVYSKSKPVASKIDEDMIFIFRSTPFFVGPGPAYLFFIIKLYGC